jgi:small subunit ribosomal protein S19
MSGKRSIWKGPFLNLNLLKKKTKIWSRNSIITPQFLNKKIKIYNGSQFISTTITEEKIGHKFGEFALTRKKYIHKLKKKIKV